MKSLLVSWLGFKLALSLGESFQDFFHLLTSFVISLCSMNSTQVVALCLNRIIF